MSQVIMQMTAQLTQGQTRFDQAMADIRSQQLQINRNVERSVEYKDRSEMMQPENWLKTCGSIDFMENGAVSEKGLYRMPQTGHLMPTMMVKHGFWSTIFCRQTQIYPNLAYVGGPRITLYGGNPCRPMWSFSSVSVTRYDPPSKQLDLLRCH